MPAKVTFIDTSVLCELLEVPGMCGNVDDIRAEFELRAQDGERFVIPITAVIETGNHIAQSGGDRHDTAGRFVRFITAVINGTSPFTLHRLDWDDAFLSELCAGNATGQPLADLAARRVGAGDVAILVERDRFRKSSAFSDVSVWTLDSDLAAYA
jgi:hypothetical protein